jgi:hypothetical protein
MIVTNVCEVRSLARFVACTAHNLNQKASTVHRYLSITALNEKAMYNRPRKQ